MSKKVRNPEDPPPPNILKISDIYALIVAHGNTKRKKVQFYSCIMNKKCQCKNLDTNVRIGNMAQVIQSSCSPENSVFEVLTHVNFIIYNL